MINRIGFNCFILLSILVLPWQSYVLFIIAGFFLYDDYVEGMVWGYLLDTLWGGVFDGYYWYSLLTVAGFGLVMYTKPYIRFYD